ncbi:MAG: methionine ABC transporter ATP-binding protein [Alphaproteobacteria bacterium]|nr:methionine ABC transporter ATP-binding protein [Alphaproteobacteria bacterium]
MRFDRVGKTFPARRNSPAVAALAEIDLAIPRGSIVGVIGRSGAGKSTLIRLVNGLERPSTGRVLVDGTDLAGLDEPALRRTRRAIGMIFQHFNLLSSRTAFGNIALPLEIAGVRRQDIAPRVERLLELVGLADKRNRYPAELSGGQKQRVGIARALALNPKVLLSDEATSALDPETTQSILKLLSHINAELGVTILLITHEMHVVKSICRDVAVLERGRIVEHGRAFDVLADPQHETTASLVAPVLGASLPPGLAACMSPAPIADGWAVLRVRFTGEGAGEPLIGRVAAALGGEINIQAGQIDSIAGLPLGTFIMTVRAAPATVQRALILLTRDDVRCEVLGYVA